MAEFHLRALHIRGILASLGTGCLMWGVDIPACFRNQMNRRDLLPLFLYILDSDEYGIEFFADLCNSFGWRASQWGWQAMLGVITWHFKDIKDPLAYVDIFFIFSAAARRVDHRLKIAHFELDMGSVGASFHEKQDSGNVLNALGWD
jgi:hypothetical protein